MARDRARIVSNVRYRIAVDLRPHAARMPGHIEIDFDLAQATDPLPLDFRGDGLAGNLKINGSPAEIQRSNGHILLSPQSLRAGANSVAMDFESGIAEANRPITRYVDTSDGNEYLYTLFVPMDASLAFPCFDQPDLKARFTLNVSAPASWIVISNTPAVAEERMIVDRRESHGTRFAETRPISTYLFAFAAGPFQAVESSGLRLFVRRSMYARAKEEWPAVADLTHKGMALMTAFFAQPFPFPKYDQVLIPGFPYGGMEHAGATFLNEDSVLFRTVPTVNDTNRRAETVLHELAHQWFGDLVTMRWFDDLWLKEGFAQYMAFHTLAQMEPPETVWKRFYESIKPQAYAIDATHGTTPIYQRIPNLLDAKSAYGAIVYQKAPALLRVLAYDIGEDHFRDGVRAFLREHAYGNAEWSDLIGDFSHASGVDLRPWAKAWIEQRGMPQVEIDWSCDANRKISSFQIRQKDVLDEGYVWPIRTQVLLGYADGRFDHVAAALDGAKAAAPAAIGKSCPAFVFGNDEDQAYGLFLLDAKSQAAVVSALPHIADTFRRALLWGALWDDVRDSRMAPAVYLDLGLHLLPAEKDAELAVSILGRMRTAFTEYLPDNKRAAFADRFENLLIREIANAPTTDLRITYFRGLIAVATTAHARGVLMDFLAGRMAIPGVPLKERDRWNIVGALVADGDSSAHELLTAETRRDTSDDGRKYAWVSGAGFATPETKKKYFAEYLTSAGVKEDWVTASLPMFNYWTQAELTSPFLEPALAALPQLKRDRKIFFVVDWLDSFVGGQHSRAALETVDRFLKEYRADPDLRLKILEVRDELARTVRILEAQ